MGGVSAGLLYLVGFDNIPVIVHHRLEFFITKQEYPQRLPQVRSRNHDLKIGSNGQMVLEACPRFYTLRVDFVNAALIAVGLPGAVVDQGQFYFVYCGWEFLIVYYWHIWRSSGTFATIFYSINLIGINVIPYPQPYLP